MIQFKGEYTGITRKYAGRYSARYITYTAIIVTIIIGPACAWFFGSVFRSMNTGIAYICFILSGLPWFQYTPFTKKEPLLAKPCITIGNGYVSYQTVKCKANIAINQVKSVQEFQEFFLIKAKGVRIFCQKTCLVEGTAEDVRAIFTDQMQHCEEKELKKVARYHLLASIAIDLLLLPISHYVGFVLK